MTRTPGPSRRVPRMLIAALAAFAVAALCIGGPLTRTAAAAKNPTRPQIKLLLRDAGVEHTVPPKILYAIAWQESTWRQFVGGKPLISDDGGIGIMQVTSTDGFDIGRLKTDIEYNIDAGVQILLEKWSWTPHIGDHYQGCYEDWFYAVWAYNGWVPYNKYPYKVWALVAKGPQDLWDGQPVTAVPKSALDADGYGVAIDTPEPAHYWSATPQPAPTLSKPEVPATAALKSTVTITGTLSPQHLAGKHSVEVRCYLARGSRWELRETILAKNVDDGELTRYTVRYIVRKAGRWRVIAYAAADADHSAGVSKPAEFRVK